VRSWSKSRKIRARTGDEPFDITDDPGMQQVHGRTPSIAQRLEKTKVVDRGEVSWQQRCLYAAIGALALWVGAWGFFVPELVDTAIPWLVPPLHAQFLGAVYLSGLAALLRMAFARHWYQVRVMVPVVAIWTGMLFVVSLVYLDQFDAGAFRVQVWFFAYTTYPVLLLVLAWRHLLDRAIPDGSAAPFGLIRRGYFVLGVVLIALATALLFFTDRMLTLWPWKIGRMLAQIYSAPILAYGVAGVRIARSQRWAEARIAATSLGSFAVMVLVASVRHRGLFSRNDPEDWVWFLALIATAALWLGSMLQARSQEAAATTPQNAPRWSRT
jgi:hypothetical protein